MEIASQRVGTLARASTVVILDVGPRGPGALAAVASHRRRLDWVFHAFDAVLEADFYLVTEHQQDSIARRYPRLSVLTSVPPAAAGTIGSLLTAPLRGDRGCYVTRADLVFRSHLVELLAASGGDVVVAIDGSPGRRRGAGPEAGSDRAFEEAGVELVGIARLSPRAVACLAEMRRRGDGRLAETSLPELLRELVARGLEVRTVESEGDWARLDAPHDLARFILGTKAESLERLRPLVRRSTIGPQVRCRVSEWSAAPQAVLARVMACFGARALAVRSSSSREDDWTASAAGHFTSILGVAPEPDALGRAIDAVIASYGGDGGDGGGGGDRCARCDQQVLIQEMLDPVQLSGVVLTRTLSQGLPYYTINYDDATGHTGCVTGGAGKDLRTVVVHRSKALDGAPEHDPRLLSVLQAVRELEELVGHDSLDIEFAVAGDGEVHILQLRPIAVNPAGARGSDELLEEALQLAGAQLDRAQVRGPGLVGRRACFGVMPDWNPAEIIGTCPRRLAESLYRHLITDEVWAVQRAECGYRDVRPNPLMITLAGHPYIDIRLSFNSFIPASLDDRLAGRLVDHYLERLQRYPHLHDKIEFDIAFTCVAFDFEQRAQEQLHPAGFTAAEIAGLRAGLRGITAEIMRRHREDLERIELLGRRYDALMQERRDPSGPLGPLDRAAALLADCRKYGTLPFAHLARGAFVAMTLLRSLKAVGISTAEQEAFLGSLSTVTREFERDGGRVAAGQMSWSDFVGR